MRQRFAPRNPHSAWSRVNRAGLEWIARAKRPETRERRIARTVTSAAGS
ncbi:YdeI/OmpD-associated family protein [Pseudonocardia sp. DLS-67]